MFRAKYIGGHPSDGFPDFKYEVGKEYPIFEDAGVGYYLGGTKDHYFFLQHQIEKVYGRVEMITKIADNQEFHLQDGGTFNLEFVFDGGRVSFSEIDNVVFTKAELLEMIEIFKEIHDKL